MLLVYGPWGEETPDLGIQHVTGPEALFDAIEPQVESPEPTTVFVASNSNAHQAAWIRTVLEVPFSIVTLNAPVTRRILTVYLIKECLEERFHGLGGRAVNIVDPFLETRFMLSSVLGLNQPSPSIFQMIQSLIPNTIFEADVDSEKVTKLPSVRWQPNPDGVSLEARKWRTKTAVPLEFTPSRTHFAIVPPKEAVDWGQRKAKNWVEVTWTEETIEEIGEALEEKLKPEVCESCGQYCVGSPCLVCGYTTENGGIPAPAGKVLEV